MKEYYEILELQLDATEKDLKDSFRRLSKKYHPDKNDGSSQFVDKFRLVRDAYERILVFMKSAGYSAWKQKNNKSSKQTSNHSEKYTKNRTANYSDININKATGIERSTSENFNFYEFLNKGGLYEENIFQSSAKSIRKQYSLNEVILVGNIEYKLIGFHFINELGNNIFKTKSDGQFLIVELEIKNMSKIMLPLHNYMFRLFDYDGYFFEFSNNGLSAMYLLQEPIIPFFGKELNPRLKSFCKLIFEVPEIGDYFIQLCGGHYIFDNNNICICEEVAIVKLNNGC